MVVSNSLLYYYLVIICYNCSTFTNLKYFSLSPSIHSLATRDHLLNDSKLILIGCHQILIWFNVYYQLSKLNLVHLCISLSNLRDFDFLIVQLFMMLHFKISKNYLIILFIMVELLEVAST